MEDVDIEVGAPLLREEEQEEVVEPIILETRKPRLVDKMQETAKGQPEEIAKAVIFLIKNDYITGQVLNVDGGRVI